MHLHNYLMGSCYLHTQIQGLPLTSPGGPTMLREMLYVCAQVHTHIWHMESHVHILLKVYTQLTCLPVEL
jgi:hypothetical protein